MVIAEFVQNSVSQLCGQMPANLRIKISQMAIENPTDLFIAQLRNSGAKVVISKDGFYFSKAFGPISQRLSGKTRRQIRKSLAFLRLRKNARFNIRAELGVATHAGILISKKDITKLQLSNQCTFAKLYIDSEDITHNFTQADFLLEQRNQSDGYYISGPNPLAQTPFNMVRQVAKLVVYVVEKEKIKHNVRAVF